MSHPSLPVPAAGAGPSVLAVRWGRLGDVVCTWPALHWLSARRRVALWTAPALRPLCRLALPRVDVLEALPSDADAVLDLHRVPTTRRQLRRVAARRVVRVDKESLRRRGLLLGAPARLAPRWSWPERHLRAAARLEGVAVPEVAWPPWPSTYSPQPGRLGILVGAGHPTKAWPIARAAELAALWPGTVEAIAGPMDPVQAGTLPVSRPPDPVALARALERCEVVVGGDTGPLHLARAVGARVLALLGPTPLAAGFWAPDEAAPTSAECAPCSLHGARRCGQPQGRCMDRHTGASVLARLARGAGP